MKGIKRYEYDVIRYSSSAIVNQGYVSRQTTSSDKIHSFKSTTSLTASEEGNLRWYLTPLPIQCIIDYLANRGLTELIVNVDRRRV